MVCTVEEFFEQAGLVDEQLGRTEDNELHYRIRKHGYKIRFSPNVLSYQYIRPTFKKMLHQKYSNGLWIGLTTHVKPRCLSSFIMFPLLLMLSIFVGAMLLPFSPLFFSASFCSI